MIQSINIYSTVIPYTQHVLIINVISMRVQKFINFFFSLIACIPLLGIIQLSTKNYPTKGKNFQAFICHNSLEIFSHNKLPKNTIQLQQADPLQNKPRA